MTKHVVFTVNTAWNILNFRRPILDAFLRAGHQVTVLAPRDEAVPELEALGCSFIPLEMDKKGLSPLGGLKLVRTYRRHLKKIRPDVVLSYTIKNNLFGALAARSRSIPFIPNVTGLGTAFLSGGLLEIIAETLYKICFRGLRTVFFQNEEDRDLFISRGLVKENQAVLLPGSGIDLEKFAVAPYPDENKAVHFLQISRLLKDKGVLEYVEAARLVRKSYPSVVFQLLGAMGAENRTAIDVDSVDAWQKEGVITYLGETRDVRPFITEAHCIVLPSYREGAPRTLIEAAAMARPIIATDVPGCRSVLDDQKTGFLCDVRSGESLAKACIDFLALEPEQRRAMGAAGRQKMVEHYDQAIVVAAYQKAIREQVRGF